MFKNLCLCSGQYCDIIPSSTSSSHLKQNKRNFLKNNKNNNTMIKQQQQQKLSRQRNFNNRSKSRSNHVTTRSNPQNQNLINNNNNNNIKPFPCQNHNRNLKKLLLQNQTLLSKPLNIKRPIVSLNNRIGTVNTTSNIKNRLKLNLSKVAQATGIYDSTSNYIHLSNSYSNSTSNLVEIRDESYDEEDENNDDDDGNDSSDDNSLLNHDHRHDFFSNCDNNINSSNNSSKTNDNIICGYSPNFTSSTITNLTTTTTNSIHFYHPKSIQNPTTFANNMSTGFLTSEKNVKNGQDLEEDEDKKPSLPCTQPPLLTLTPYQKNLIEFIRQNVSLKTAPTTPSTTNQQINNNNVYETICNNENNSKKESENEYDELNKFFNDPTKITTSEQNHKHQEEIDVVQQQRSTDDTTTKSSYCEMNDSEPIVNIVETCNMSGQEIFYLQPSEMESLNSRINTPFEVKQHQQQRMNKSKVKLKSQRKKYSSFSNNYITPMVNLSNMYQKNSNNFNESFLIDQG
jgi:hypothetical protein